MAMMQESPILPLLLLWGCSLWLCLEAAASTTNRNGDAAPIGPSSRKPRPAASGGGRSPPIVSCTGPACTVQNAYGQWPDRGQCRAAAAVFPATEQEVIEAVAGAARRGQPVKVATATGHSRPRWACPRGREGLVISTRELNRRIDVDQSAMRVTVDSGVQLRRLIDTLARAGLALPHSPYLDAITIGGLISTGSQGSSLLGRGPAVHDYVESMRLIVAAPPEEGYAKAVQVDAGDELLLNSAKISLGLLGVITQVTLVVELQFKRAIEKESIGSDDNLEEVVLEVGRNFEFGDVTWLPSMHKMVVSKEWRVPSQTPGVDRNPTIAFRPMHFLIKSGIRTLEELSERSLIGKCALASLLSSGFLRHGFRLPFLSRERWPKVGYNHEFQSSGSCATSQDPNRACLWARTGSRDLIYSEACFTIPLENATNFLQDLKKLRRYASSSSFCVIDTYSGMLFRYLTPSEAFLGHHSHGISVDMLIHRANHPHSPRLLEDIFEEIEQIAFLKYGAVPNWAKNRPLAFMNLRSKYPNMHQFLAAKSMLDPEGLFSNEWSDSALEIAGNVTTDDDYCALEGLCVCREDRHCAPEAGYFCQQGKVFKEARVCAKRGTDSFVLKLLDRSGFVVLMQSFISFVVTTGFDIFISLQDLFELYVPWAF